MSDTEYMECPECGFEGELGQTIRPICPECGAHMIIKDIMEGRK